MQAVYHVDNNDLTWRKRAAFIRHLPETAAVFAIDRDGPAWTLTDHLLDDVCQWLMVVAGAKAKEIKPHPQRPKAPKHVDPARMKKFIDGRKRAAERRRRIAAGEIT